MSPELLNLIDTTPVMHGIAPWIIPAIVAVAGQFLGKDGGSSAGAGSSQQMTPEMRTMFNLELQKQRAQTPLYNNVLMMANRMLPVWARQQNVMGTQAGPNGIPLPGDPGTDGRVPSPNSDPVSGRHALPRY